MSESQGRIRQLEAQLHSAQVKARYFQEENVRLRARVHEAVDECQRRYAPDMSELTRFRWLAVWADQEIDRYFSGGSWRMSTFERTIVARLIDRIAKAERKDPREALGG